jgi:hypothetical protein
LLTTGLHLSRLTHADCQSDKGLRQTGDGKFIRRVNIDRIATARIFVAFRSSCFTAGNWSSEEASLHSRENNLLDRMDACHASSTIFLRAERRVRFREV